MKEERKKMLSKVAYLYYIEGKSQSEIATEIGIYRTTISRMLTEAKNKGIVKIEIENFDSRLFKLEEFVKEKYNLKGLEIIANQVDEPLSDLEQRLAKSAARIVHDLLADGMKVGFSWGRSLSLLVEQINSRRLNGVKFFPLSGGPSHIHASYHVNTLIYKMADKFHGDCHFINSIIVQENKETADSILSAKYFEDLRLSWQNLDLAVIGIGGYTRGESPQWFDMLTKQDIKELELSKAVGEICCRFFSNTGMPVSERNLQKRVISIALEELKRVPNRVSLAYGEKKAQAILSVLKAGYVNHFVTDESTILKILDLDK